MIELLAGADAADQDFLQGDDNTPGQVAYARIRNDIIFAILKPGERLKLEPLKVKYNTSVTTLREVLNRLSSEGFVTAEGQKGFTVASVSAEGLREVAVLRQLIECHALEESIRMGDLGWEGRVVGAHYILASVEEKMMDGKPVDLKQWKQFDREFHTTLISARRSEFLLKIHSNVYDHYLRYQVIALGFRGKAAAEEHQLLMKHALSRRSADGVKVLVAHIQNGVEHALANGPFASRDN